MKPKNYLSLISILALFAAITLLSLSPAPAAETADTGIAKCSVEAYVADTDPKGINVRSGPGQNYPVVATLPYHSTVTIFGAVGEWTIINEDSPHRWVYGPLLAVGAHTNPNAFFWRDPTGLVPIYGESSDDFAIIAWAPQGTVLRVIGCKHRSVKVRYKGVEGWLLRDSYSGYPPLAVTPSGGTETAGIEIIPCENVAAYLIDKDPKGANVRCGPGPDYYSIVTLPTDRPVQVRIVGSLKDWVLIKDPAFRSKESGEMTMEVTGWVKAPLLGVRAENTEDFAGPVSLYKDANAESGGRRGGPGGHRCGDPGG